jgi:hypothetical protein
MLDTAPRNKSSGSLIKSKRRVTDHGEVFTPAWLVEKMLNLVGNETKRIDARFFEPACGNGNFLLPILLRKLSAVDVMYKKSYFERRHRALFALTCIYGVELLADNIADCRTNMLECFAEFLDLQSRSDFYRAASFILSRNIIHGDAINARGSNGKPIIISEWTYLEKGIFRKRDLRLDSLLKERSQHESKAPSRGLQKDNSHQQSQNHSVMTVADLATHGLKVV